MYIYIYIYILTYDARKLKHKIKGTYQLLVYADDVNKLGGSVHSIKKHTEALLVDSKECGLYVSAKETKYMVMSGDQKHTI